MKKALCYIDKPVVFIPFEQIAYCEFGAGAGYSRGPTRNFNLDVSAGGTVYQFSTLDKREYNGLVEFLQSAGVKLKNLEKSKPPAEAEADDDDDDEEDDGSYEEGEDSDDDDEEDDGSYEEGE